MKNNIKYLLLVFSALLLLCSCARQEKPQAQTGSPAAEPIPPVITESFLDEETVFGVEPVPEPEPDPKQEAIETILSSMSLEEKVGQMFFVRCPSVNAEAKISKYHLGGYLLFLQDFKDIFGEWLTAEAFTDKIAAYQSSSPIPLLIGVDEEGGTVARASRNPNLFSEKFKSPQEIYASGGMEAVALDAANKHRDLLGYGINVNYAPVADVSTNPADFIYARSFGQDAQATAEFVEAVVTAAGNVSVSDGDTLYKIGSVLKHFPGYGDNADTHTGIAIDERPYEQFTAEDFLPFQAGIEAGAGSVLVSHNVVKCMDEDLPASLSPNVHRILREELGFEGVILTDDLAMDAVEAYAKDGSAAVLAVLAGNDMIVTTDFETQIPLVIEAVQAGLIDETMIDSAVRRVLDWKYSLGLIE